MTTNHQLSAEEISLAYGERTIIDSLSVDIVPGKITSIVGPNGCGKSTLLRAFARLLKPSAGQALIDAHPLPSLPGKELARMLGLLPQSPPHLKASSSPTSWAAAATPTKDSWADGPHATTK